MGVKTNVSYGEIHFTSLLKCMGKEKVQVAEISKYPAVRRDLALVIDKKVKFAEIEQIAKQSEKKILKQISLFDVYENKQQLGEDKKSYAVSFVFEDSSKTLSDKEIDHIMNKISTQLLEKLGANIRK
jgi:phenylalanyl-tRNA synthetase beta chain